MELPRLAWGAVPVGVLLAAASIVLGVWLKEFGVAGTGAEVIAAVQERRSPALDVAALALQYGLSVPAGVGWLVLVGLVLWVVDDGAPVRALVFISLAVPGWLATAVVKPVVERARPGGVALFGQLSEVGPHSFPSAHVSLAAGMGWALVLVFCWHHGTVIRAAGLVGALALAVAAGWSRVYLGVHYPGDALGSILLTTATQLVWLPILARLLQQALPPAPV
ncbi:hypothetical protein GCM10009696_08980 [Kocuria himachalensis]